MLPFWTLRRRLYADDDGDIQHGLIEYSKTTEERWPLSTVFPFANQARLGYVTFDYTSSFEAVANPGDIGPVLRTISNSFRLLPSQHYFMPFHRDHIPPGISAGEAGSGLVSTNPLDAFVELQTPLNGGMFSGGALLRQRYEWIINLGQAPGLNTVPWGTITQVGYVPIAVLPGLLTVGGGLNKSVDNQFQGYRDYVIRISSGQVSVDSFDVDAPSQFQDSFQPDTRLPAVEFTPEGVLIHRNGAGQYTTTPPTADGRPITFSFALTGLEWIHPPY
jgi:hypothetical protein